MLCQSTLILLHKMTFQPFWLHLTVYQSKGLMHELLVLGNGNGNVIINDNAAHRRENNIFGLYHILTYLVNSKTIFVLALGNGSEAAKRI